MKRLPLSGVRVADFTWIGAGSFTTKMLADFGADVIKVESTASIDPLRKTGPFKDGKPGVNRSGYFADRNTSKRSIRLDLKQKAGVELARELIAKSDIVANNFTPGTMDRFGLGYADVIAFKPDIIYLAMSMQGATGPDSNFVGFGLTIGALAGLHLLSGYPERAPSGTGTNYPDHIPNPGHGAFAVLAALHAKRRTGQGQFIDFAQTEPTIAQLGPAIIEYTANGRVPERCGNRHWNAAPHNVFPCKGKDRWIAISIYDDTQWQNLVSVLGPVQGDLAAKVRNSAERRQHLHEVEAWLASRTASWDAHALMAALQGHGIPAGVVQDARDVVDRDPQMRARGHWVRLPHPEMGESLYNAPPFHLSLTPNVLSKSAPLLGEHTEEVVCGLLGVSESRYAELQAQKVFE